MTLPSEAELKVESNFLIKEKGKPENAESSKCNIMNECEFPALAKIDIVKHMSMLTQMKKMRFRECGY